MSIIPASLSFLAIYSPPLGTTEETFENQIVFWYSKAARARRRLGPGNDAAVEEKELREEENKKLREIGLA